MGDDSRAAILGTHKLVVGAGVEHQALFDIAKDPQEHHDLVGEGGIALRMLRTAMAWEWAHTDEWDRARWGTGANLRPAYPLDHGM